MNDSEEFHPIRTELAAPMRLVNEEPQRRTDATTTGATMQSLGLALG